MTTTTREVVQPESNRYDENTSNWFSEFIHELNTKKFLYENRAMSHEETRMYDFMAANQTNAMLMARTGSHMYFVKNLVVDFIKELRTIEINKIAIDLSGSEVLVWIVIADSRDDIERKIILAEARINAKYSPYDYRVDTMIVEDSDNLEIPTHYIEL
jgi:hypothetical protein